MSNVLETMRSRYTTKHYAGEAVPAEKLETLLEVLRLSPTSVNGQASKFFVAEGAEARAKLIPALMDFNQERCEKCGALIVCAVPEDYDEAQFARVFEQEIKDGRYEGLPSVEGMDAGRRHFVNMHKDRGDLVAWETHQSYIAMGMLLYAAAELGVDSTALEGVEFDKMDEILGLREKGLRSVWAVALGKRAPNDSNAARPKSRLPMETVVTRLG